MVGNLDYIYTKVPLEFFPIYHGLLELMADYGEEALKECKASCTDRNTDVINCYNIFNAAISAKALNKDKLAETLKKYIEAKLNNLGVKTKGISFTFMIGENEDEEILVTVDNNGNITLSEDIDEHWYYVKIENYYCLVYVPGIYNPYTKKLFVNVCKIVGNDVNSENNILTVTTIPYIIDGKTVETLGYIQYSTHLDNSLKIALINKLEELGFSPQIVGHVDSFNTSSNNGCILYTHNGDYNGSPDIEVSFKENNISMQTKHIPTINFQNIETLIK